MIALPMKYSIALVDYLNTMPFSEGLKLTGAELQFDIHRVIPSACAQLYKEGVVAISLCPVGALTEMPAYEICGQYCIGADGPVDSVMLLSHVPVDQITTIKLDEHSRTSNLLVQVLAKKYWQKQWKYGNSLNGHEDACIMIGDKVFDNKEKFAYQYDLAQAWKSFTGLPMVFAVWIKRPEVPDTVVKAIDHAFETGFAAIVGGNVSMPGDKRDYLLNKISYRLDQKKLEALSVFQSMIP